MAPGVLSAQDVLAASGHYESYAGYSIRFVHPNPQDNPLGVSGSWNVPAISCKENGKAISGQVVPWAGLGGVAANNTLEQAGTDSQCKNGTASYWAWYEFTSAPNPNPVSITAKTRGKDKVSPGDSMSADVVEQGPGYFVTQLWDHSKGWYYAAIWQASPNSANTPQTAEWIVENPGALAPFPKFTPSVLFQNCYWAQNAAQKQLGAGPNVTRYTLYSNSLQQATTTAIGADHMSFSVKWRAYG
jgi:hypothetical protein